MALSVFGAQLPFGFLQPDHFRQLAKLTQLMA
jgi:hypothetical protein